jgi:polysaccharide export outer membrane protein
MSSMMRALTRAIASLLLIALANPFSALAAQNAAAKSAGANESGAQENADRNTNGAQEEAAATPQAPEHESSPDDVIGIDDSVAVTCLESDDVSKTWRVGSTGDINLPLVGQVHAAGLTAEQLNQKLTEALKRYINEPHVTVYIAEFRSQPVTVTGAVHRPGHFQIEGSKTLLTVLTMAGGLDHPPGSTATVVRQMKYGAIPLPQAHPDADGSHSIVELPLKDVSNASTPASNLIIRPNDVIDVSNDERMVYIIGEVAKPGKVELVSHDSISMMQVLAIAGGLTKIANPKNTQIMRQNSQGLYEKVGLIDLKKLSQGKSEDRLLNAGDIVVVPSSNLKAYTQVAAFTAIVTSFGLLTRF